MKQLILPLLDYEEEDILKYLDVSCKFIKDAIDSGGKVLVHW
jgi:protein-tyrosine phosphatase